MKVLAFILSVVLAGALVFAGSLLLVVAAPDASPGVLVLALVPLTVFLYGPTILGSIRAYWDVTGSDESRRYFALWYRIILALEVLAAVAIVLFTVLAGAPAWLPLVFITGGALLTVLALLVGRALRRRDVARAVAPPPWAAISRHEIVRKIAVIAIVFVAVLVIGIVVFTVLLSMSEKDVPTVALSLLFAAEFAFFGASFACSIVTLPLNRRLRDSVGGDLGLLRKVGRVVLKAKPIDLNLEEQVKAAKYAVLVSVVFPFQLAIVVLLYAGFVLQQVQFLVTDIQSPFAVFFLIAFPVLLVVLVVLHAVRIRRARRYARQHADLVPAAEAAPTVQEG